MIHWTPISEMPPELRDGRDVLVLLDGVVAVVVRSWGTADIDDGWHDDAGDDYIDDDFTHYSEINEPGVRDAKSN